MQCQICGLSGLKNWPEYNGHHEQVHNARPRRNPDRKITSVQPMPPASQPYEFNVKKTTEAVTEVKVSKVIDKSARFVIESFNGEIREQPMPIRYNEENNP